MSTTRIFVRSLPPTINDDDFKAHFSARYNVTDVKLFQSRRIGYVGFKTSSEAAAAVKYFDKSFMRMSRLRVELADDEESTKKSMKRKLEVAAKNEQKIKDDSVLERGFIEQKRQKTATNDATTDSIDPAHAHLPFAMEVLQGKLEDTQTPQNTTESEPVVPQSDQDWIRSRTSRLLGLVEDEDDEVIVEEPPSANTDTLQQETAASEEEAYAAQEPRLDLDSQVEDIRLSKRLFLRNLPYSVTEDEISDVFTRYGKLDEVQLPQDHKTGNLKGFAFVAFHDAEAAVEAYTQLDGTSFQGRILHILPGSAKPEPAPEPDLSALPVKQQRHAQRRTDATRPFNWNSLYLNADAVVTSVASRLGVSKSDILDPTSSDAAVRQAQAETHVIQDTKKYFTTQGINLDAFKSSVNSTTCILVKNFAYGTTTEQLRDMFAAHGEVSRVLMPPSGAIAIVEMRIASQASAAFGALAYRKYQDSVLFLEKAPRDIFGTQTTIAATAAGPIEDDNEQPSSTLFVRNISFDTSAAKFRATFAALAGFISARIKTKTDPKRPGEVLSMGFGFLEFQSTEQAKSARMAMDGFSLDGHRLLIRDSHKGHDAAESRRLTDQAHKRNARKSKIVIKNLPFEATKKDVRSLFMTYGKLRAVRVPKKFDNSRKGYAFAEFTTPREAESAMEALGDTHLLGRRLVLEFAAGEADDPETEIARMQEKVGRQVNSVALQQLASTSERRKFVSGREDEVM